MNRKPSQSKELQAAEHFVRLAMAQAEYAARSDHAPFAAVIVDTLGDVVAAEHNRVRETLDSSAHAEINGRLLLQLTYTHHIPNSGQCLFYALG